MVVRRLTKLGVDKSSLIDLKTLPRYGEGNKGQDMKRLMECSVCHNKEDDDEGTHVGPHDSMFICKYCYQKKHIIVGNKLCKSRKEEHYSCLHVNEHKKLLVNRILKIDEKEFLFEESVDFCPICGFSYQPERSKREDSKEMRCSEHDGNTVREVQ